MNDASGPRTVNVMTLGCAAMAALGLLVVLGIFFAWRYVKAHAPEWAFTAARTQIEAAELPLETRTGLAAELDRVRTAYDAGEIGYEELLQVVGEVLETPLLPVGVVLSVDSLAIAPSGLSDEEKSDARLQLTRVARGVHEGAIPGSEVPAVLEPIAERTDERTLRIRRPVQDDDLRAVLARARSVADAASVASEPWSVDLVAELRTAVDVALAR